MSVALSRTPSDFLTGPTSQLRLAVSLLCWVAYSGTGCALELAASLSGGLGLAPRAALLQAPVYEVPITTRSFSGDSRSVCYHLAPTQPCTRRQKDRQHNSEMSKRLQFTFLQRNVQMAGE